jgi:hypothetical protein
MALVKVPSKPATARASSFLGPSSTGVGSNLQRPAPSDAVNARLLLIGGTRRALGSIKKSAGPSGVGEQGGQLRAAMFHQL